MKKLLFGIVIALIVTVPLFVLAGFLGGACHCVTPTTVFFPYTAIVWATTNWDWIGLLIITIQFPIYASVLVSARVLSRRWKLLALILVTHIAAVLVGLRVYRH